MATFEVADSTRKHAQAKPQSRTQVVHRVLLWPRVWARKCDSVRAQWRVSSSVRYLCTALPAVRERLRRARPRAALTGRAAEVRASDHSTAHGFSLDCTREAGIHVRANSVEMPRLALQYTQYASRGRRRVSGRPGSLCGQRSIQLTESHMLV